MVPWRLISARCRSLQLTFAFLYMNFLLLIHLIIIRRLLFLLLCLMKGQLLNISLIKNWNLSILSSSLFSDEIPGDCKCWSPLNTKQYRKDANAGHHSQSNKEKIDSKINLRGVVGTLFQNTPIQQSLFQVVNHNLSLTNQSYFISALFDCFTWTILNCTDKDMAFVHVRLTLLTQSCTTKSAQLDHFHFQLFASLGNQLITEPNDLMSHVMIKRADGQITTPRVWPKIFYCYYFYVLKHKGLLYRSGRREFVDSFVRENILQCSS